MDTINFGALITFVIISTFSPGPNNISSSSMGILYGYKKTLNYLLGIAIGFSGIMLLCGLISHTLYAVFPSVEVYMRLIGAAYILYLAYKTLKATYQFSEENSQALGFANGILLQLLNPKAWVFGLTLYTSFLAGITNQIPLLLLSAIVLAGVAFCAITTWAISGAAISQLLRNPKFQQGLNIALAILLAVTAIELSGII